jgi:8-amino-7-oxononanoate synthase
VSAFSATLKRARETLELHQVAEAEGFFPYFRKVEAQPEPVVMMDGADRIMLGSNNYLGLTSDPRVKAAARAALDRYGTALTGSRLLNGTTALHLELEAELAQLMGTEAAIAFATGYQANCGTLAALVSPGDAVVCDSANHASILDGIAVSGGRLVPYRHGRLDRLDAALGRASAEAANVIVVVDGVFSMEGGLCDLRAVAELCQKHQAALIVDEAHAAGVLGERRAGACDLLGVEDMVELRTGTLSKAFASCGGFVAGPAELLAYLRVEARAFVFSAAAVPAAVGAALEAVRICRSAEGRERATQALQLARYLREGLTGLGFPLATEVTQPEEQTPIVSLRIGDEIRTMCLWKALYDHGVYVNAAVYPAVPRNGALLRASVMATHDQRHLDQALDAFSAINQEAAAGFFTQPV